MNEKRYIWRPYFVLLTLVMTALRSALIAVGLVKVLIAFWVKPADFTSWGGWLTLGIFMPFLWFVLKMSSKSMRSRFLPVSRSAVKSLQPGENPRLRLPEWTYAVGLVVWFFGGTGVWIWGYDELFGLGKPGADLRVVTTCVLALFLPFLLVQRWISQNAVIQPGFLSQILNTRASVEDQPERLK